MTREQGVIVASAAIAVAALIGLVIVARDDRDSRRTPTVATPASAAPEVGIASPEAPVHASETGSSAKPTASAQTVPDAGEDTFDPIADDSWKLLDAAGPAAPGDVFEDPEVSVQRAKLLGKVGAIRVGYFQKGAAVSDEAAVTTILRRAALEIDRLDRDRQDPPYKRFPEYEAVLAKYRAELRPHMSGTIVVGGVGWSLGIEVQADAGA